MYLLFLDESGSPPNPEKATGQYMVIGGVIIPEGAWHGVKRDVNRVKQKFSIKGEIKSKHFGAKAKADNNPLAHLGPDDKSIVREYLFSILTRRRSIKLLSCVTCVESAYKLDSVKTKDDIYNLTYKGVTERFQYFLQDSTRVTGQFQYGLIISDHRMQQDDERLRARHHDLIDKADKFTSEYKNIVETVLFSPSHVSPGLQLADMVAGAVYRAYQYRDGRFASKIKSAFRTSPTGEISGWGIVKMPKENFIDPTPNRSSGEGAEAPSSR